MSERVHGRVPFRVKVQFRNASSLLIAYSLNLSRGGVFVETPTPPEVGSTYELEFDAPPAGAVILNGRVTWRRLVADAGGPSGVGLEFDDLSDSLGAVIDRLVSQFAGVSILLCCRDGRERETLRRMLRSLFTAAEVIGAESIELCKNLVDESVDLLVIESDDDAEGAIRATMAAAALGSPVPVVVLTSDDVLAGRLRAAGAVGRVSNPPTLAELSSEVVRALGSPTLIGTF